MRNRVLIGAIVAAFAMLAVALVIAAGLFIQRFDAIEAVQTRQKAEQLLWALEADLNQLAITTRNYAEWDATYHYVEDRDPKFLGATFSVESMTGIEVDLVGILAADGTSLYSAERIDGLAQLVVPARSEVQQLFKHFYLDDTDWRHRGAIERTVRTSQGPLAFSVVEVKRTDQSDPTGALLVFARFLDREDAVLRISQTSRLATQFTPMKPSTLASANLPLAVREWIATPDAAPVLGWNLDDDHAMSYALVPDIHGDPAILLSAQSPRDISILGRRTTWLLMGTIAALLVACGVVLSVLALRLRQSWNTQINAERRHRETLDHVGEHDSLTELPNRVYLQTRLPPLLESAASDQRLLTLLYLDLDNFKNVNDSQGHGAGDQLLKIIAQRLRDQTGPADIVIRSGGDEFVVVAPLLENLMSIQAFASRLLAAAREPVVINDVAMATTASIGVAVYPHSGDNAEALLKHADIALYRAKELGRDNFQLFDADMHTELSEHIAIEQALRLAIGTEQIYVEFQPLVDLHSGLLTSFEALARWRHPQMGSIAPGRFIPVAEKTGLILALGEHIVRIVVEQLQQWQLAGVPLVPVAVNVAPLQFERTDFSTLVRDLTLQYQLDPRWLCFEVTESAWMQNSDKHVVTIDTLRHAGSKVYIDDFGTGFSNLSYLKNLPVDAVKIDQAFVRNINVDPSDAAIVNGILAMAAQLNLDTIAEGIETAAQMERLRDMGCHRGQGYYFSKPVPAAQCRSLLEQMGEIRLFTETLKVRALRNMDKPGAAPAA